MNSLTTFGSTGGDGRLTLTSIKRKRNEEEEDPFTSVLKMSNARSFLRRFPLPFNVADSLRESSTTQYLLLKTGDLLAISEDSVAVYRNFYEQCRELDPLAPASEARSFGSNRPLSINFPISTREIRFIDCIYEYFPKTKIFKRKELFLATESGMLFFLDLLTESTVSSNEFLIQKIHLSEEKGKEKLTNYQVIQQGIIFVSNLGEVYVIDKPSFNKINADKLNRPSGNLLFGLIQSGVKSLFGFNAGNSTTAVDGAVKFSHIQTITSSTLVTVGTHLTLWGNFQNPGSEKLIYQYESFADEIKTDISRLTKTSDIRISFLQVEVVSTNEESIIDVAEETEGKKILLLLVASSPTTSHASEGENDVKASLWLHFVEIPIYSSEVDNNTSPVNIKILQRIHLTQDASLKSHGVASDGRTSRHPKMYSMPLAWRVFISWISHSERTLQSIQIDAFNQISHARNDANKRGLLSVEDYSSDTHVEETAILSLEALDNVDGFCSLVSDSEEIIVIAPRLPMLPYSKPLVPVASESASKVEGSGLYDKGKISNLLLKLAYKKNNLETDIGQLRNIFIGYPIEVIKDLIAETSLKIINRSPVGQLWGSNTAIQPSTALGASSSFLNNSLALSKISSSHEVDKTINEYQLVHRLLHDKVHQHNHLLMAIIEADAVRYEEIIIHLLQNHQKALFAHAFSDAIQELMGELPLPSEYLHAMNVLSESISEYITTQLKIRLDDISSKGLSIFDQFYAQTEKIFEGVHFIFKASIEKLKSQAKLDYELIRVVYFYLLLLQSSISKTVQGDGGEDFKTSVISNPLIREAVLSLSDFLLQSLKLIQENSSFRIQIENQILTNFLEEKEGKHLAELIRLILQGYEKESIVYHPKEKFPAELMEEDWRGEYHLTKEITIQLLMAFRFYHHSFLLSQDFHYHIGLFFSTEKHSKRYQPVLEELIEVEGYCKDTNPIPLALAYFHYLHERSRFYEILTIGRRCEELLQEFLKTKPHIASLYHVQQKQYDSAMKASFQHGVTVLNALTPLTASNVSASAKTFFSLAKLSGKVHNQQATTVVETKPKQQGVAYNAGSDPARALPTEEVEEIERKVQKQLALLKIEEDVYQYLPMMIPPSSSSITTGKKGTATSAQPSHSRSAKLILNLISFLQDLRQQPHFPPGVTPEVLVKVIGEILRIFEIESPMKSDSSALPITEASDLCVKLWKEILLLNESEWLNYAMISVLTKVMESEMKKSCFFYLIASQLYEEHYRKMIAVRVADKGAPSSKKDWWYSPLFSATLTDAVLEESDILYRYMNTEGEIVSTALEAGETTDKRQKNDRVYQVIQSCLSLIRQETEDKYT